MYSHPSNITDRARSCLGRCFSLHTRFQTAMLFVVMIALAVTVVFEICVVTKSYNFPNCCHGFMQVKSSYAPDTIQGDAESDPSLHLERRGAASLEKDQPHSNIIGLQLYPQSKGHMDQLPLESGARMDHERKLSADELETVLPKRRDGLENFDHLSVSNERNNEEREVDEEGKDDLNDFGEANDYKLNQDGISAQDKEDAPDLVESNEIQKPQLKELKSKLKKFNKKSKKKELKFTLPDDYPLFDSPYPPPVLDGHTCRDSMCSEYLQSEDDLSLYKQCLARQRAAGVYSDSKPGPCHFMDGSRRAAVALASFPGSGNTWVRGLLEKATGVCTGAIYCDRSIRASGMNGEAIRSGAVIAVKTHKISPVSWAESDSPQQLNTYGSAILIVRNPHRALISEYSRANSKVKSSNSGTPVGNNHVRVIEEEKFGNNTVWKNFVRVKIQKWKSYFEQWVVGGRKNHRPVLIVRYEDLKVNTVKEVKRMLDFLHFNYKEDDLQQRLATDFSTFQRQHKSEDFEHFKSEERKLVDQVIAQSIEYLKVKNNGETFGLEEYMGTIA